jgi:hypothetical protein
VRERERESAREREREREREQEREREKREERRERKRVRESEFRAGSKNSWNKRNHGLSLESASCLCFRRILIMSLQIMSLFQD